MNKRLVAILGLGLLVLALAAVGLHHAFMRTNFGLMITGSAASSSTLVENLSSSDSDLVMTSLDHLGQRKDTAGQTKARALLKSSDDYIWFNAALYLGAINDSQAIPYLIKGLKHPASRAYPQVLRELQSLTGQTIGMDQDRWIKWWRTRNPDSRFSFAYATIERQSAEIRTGSNILINRVIDPLQVSWMGSSIELTGLRLKAGSNPASAELLLKTAILGQFVEVERDGDQLTADGSVPALISWEPDSINDPGASAVMRQGLPPVPFTSKTSVQQFLLNSGLYELNLDAVHDAAIRAKLQSYMPSTTPTTSETEAPVRK